MPSSEKTDQILDASLAVFCRYGFNKTTMKDLAEASGISRASLYLHFSNKEAVFRAGSQRAHATVMKAVESKLNQEGPAIRRIDEALKAYLRGLMEEISASPHGQELFSSNLAFSSDITLASRQQLLELVAEALGDAVAREEIDISSTGATPREIAELIVASAEGIKATGGSGAAIGETSSLFIRILGAATSS